MLSFTIFVLTFCFRGRDIKIRVCGVCQISACPLFLLKIRNDFCSNFIPQFELLLDSSCNDKEY